MRVLFASTHGAGHFGPQVPFASALVRAGHEVLVAIPAGGVGMVEDAGLPAWALDDPPEAQWRPIFDRLPGLSDDERSALVVGEIFGRIDTRASLPRMGEVFDAWSPEVVLRDPSEFASYLEAERRGVPHLRVGIGLGATEERARELAAGAVDEIGQDLGLEADPSLDGIARSRYLTLVPPLLEDPDAPAPADVRRFRDTARAPEPYGSGLGDPLVYVSFGSVAARMGFFPDLYRGVIDALSPLPVRLLVTIGHAHDPAELGALPENVRVEQWVAQRALMPETTVMVGHGGFGSTLLALAAGVPQVLMPLFADQPQNARRVDALGAGVALEGGRDALPAVADAVDWLLGDVAAREAAGRVADDIAALRPVDDVVRAL